MDASDEPYGWSSTEYKSFKVDDDSSDSESESESESDSESGKKGLKGYKTKTYKKILTVEELLPE
jgi:hypothetical protein